MSEEEPKPFIPDKPTRCDRCGRIVDPEYFVECTRWLFPYPIENDCDGSIEWRNLCWDCDWEMMNNWAILFIERFLTSKSV